MKTFIIIFTLLFTTFSLNAKDLDLKDFKETSLKETNIEFSIIVGNYVRRLSDGS